MERCLILSRLREKEKRWMRETERCVYSITRGMRRLKNRLNSKTKIRMSIFFYVYNLHKVQGRNELGFFSSLPPPFFFSIGERKRVYGFVQVDLLIFFYIEKLVQQSVFALYTIWLRATWGGGGVRGGDWEGESRAGRNTVHGAPILCLGSAFGCDHGFYV